MMQQSLPFETVPIIEDDQALINFLYRSYPGKILLFILTRRWLSQLIGWLLSTRLSSHYVRPFIRKSGIDMDDYDQETYDSFNDFFVRKINPEKRPFSMEERDLVAPCDGFLTAYPITGQQFFIKQRDYTLYELLQDRSLADSFRDGTALIFRLEPRNYHRYAFIQDGTISLQKRIPGKLHTVRPLAHRKYQVFGENTREYTLLQTDQGHGYLQMEVGAMLVGKINNHRSFGAVLRGEEKGMFEFGGSTIILLFKKGDVQLLSELFDNTAKHLESVVKMGQVIGRWQK